MTEAISKLKGPSPPLNIKVDEIVGTPTFYDGEYCDMKELVHNSRSLAIKLISKQKIPEESYKKEYERIYNEIKILYSLKHENIIELLGHMETDQYIILIFPKFGNPIKKYVRSCIDKAKKGSKRADIDDFHLIFKQIVSAVEELHCNGCIHRDISD